MHNTRAAINPPSSHFALRPMNDTPLASASISRLEARLDCVLCKRIELKRMREWDLSNDNTRAPVALNPKVEIV